MFRMILYTQWKWSRLVVLPAVLAGFALPLLSVQLATRTELNRWQVRGLLDSVASWGVFYPVLAATLAVLLAITAWGSDHRGKHVYALSLPVPRWHYALLRLGAGAVLLVAPVVALWIGALLATASASIPAGLHADPTALALRFALATLVAYTIVFSISAGTTRTAGYILAAVAVVFAVQVLVKVAGVNINLVGTIIDRIQIWPGPLEIFTGRWMLIDV